MSSAKRLIPVMLVLSILCSLLLTAPASAAQAKSVPPLQMEYNGQTLTRGRLIYSGSYLCYNGASVGDEFFADEEDSYLLFVLRAKVNPSSYTGQSMVGTVNFSFQNTWVVKSTSFAIHPDTNHFGEDTYLMVYNERPEYNRYMPSFSLTTQDRIDADIQMDVYNYHK